jgi:hypothetical protein
MNEVLTLLKPRIWPLRKRGLKANGNSKARLLLLGAIGLLFWCGIFAVSWRVLIYFKGIEDIGDILGYKLLSMMLVVSFALLLFSSILTSLSKLYLSRDLLLVHSMPVSPNRHLLLCQHDDIDNVPGNYRFGDQYSDGYGRRHIYTGQPDEECIYFRRNPFFCGNLSGDSPFTAGIAG